MGEPSTKRQKTGSKPKPSNDSTGPQITDPRFANIQSDPRYRLPGKKDKVKLDKRFSRALKDEDFTRRAKVDRYGRPIASDAERERLKRKYEFEDEEEDAEIEGAGDEVDDDDEVQRELSRVNKVHDPLREGKDIESSSDESTTSDDESDEDEDEEEDIDEEAGVGPTQQIDVPTGEVTSRIAIVNLDWDNIRAADLMAVFSSFLPPSGSLLKVAIYPSEFGKERLEREELEGPPKEIFANRAKEDLGENDDDDEEEEDGEEAIKRSILKPDDGADFDSKALRRYQLERLRYFYCILTFSSPEVAKHIYDAVDGTEYQRTANFFDLRFVPDDTDFSTDIPREECDKIPDDYRPNEFVTDALQHSKVKLTWDAEDRNRKEAVARAFKGGRKEIEENDLKAYLGSDSSEDEDADEEVGGTNANASTSISKKEAERQRMRALLGLAPEPEKKAKSKKEKAPVGDMLVTFTSGLAPTGGDGKKRSVFENSPEPEETTVERYIRKERERKQKRKEKRKAGKTESGADDSDNDAPKAQGKDSAVADHDTPEEGGDQSGDLGFDDPFFADEPSAKHERAAGTKMRKEERLKKKREREAEEEAERKQRAELELLMVDDSVSANNGEPKLRHFDMEEIEKAEKLAKKKNKNKKRKDKTTTTSAAGAEPDAGDDFKVDASDPRFTRLFTSHEYAIDPTNPRFKGTKAMKTLLEEGRKLKQKKNRTGEDVDVSSRGKGVTDKTVDGAGDVKSLVEKIKQRQTKKVK